ncbi:hypothetical protein [Streptomyces noursei]|uniref:hypothetical protein n=1 Tax=Streptomyces noursei TaxID=1971 RepID=UPI003B8A5E0B
MPVEDLGGVFGAVEFSPGGDFCQEVPPVLAGGFSAGEGGGQGGLGGVPGSVRNV